MNPARKLLIKAALTVIGLAALSLGASVALTDAEPSTLPARTWRMLADIPAINHPPPGFVPNPPLVGFPVVPVHAAGPEVRDECYVVGVEFNGECRAYPLNMLSRPDHHVLNDTLGGKPIAVTWCGLCQSPVVYLREIDGRPLTLFVSGELYGENMLMKDVETDSDWPQMLGDAISGPLKGKSLERIPSVWSDWSSWRTEHPDTTLIKISQSVDYYRHDVEHSSSSFENRYFSNLQWGFVRNGRALSWPLQELARHRAVNDSFGGLSLVIIFARETTTIAAFERRVNDTELTFRWQAAALVDDQTSSVWDPVTGRAVRGKFAGRRLTPVAGIVSHFRAWLTLHPETMVRSAPPNGPDPHER